MALLPGERLAKVEEAYIELTLRHVSNNIGEAAALLGISPRTVRNRIAVFQRDAGAADASRYSAPPDRTRSGRGTVDCRGQRSRSMRATEQLRRCGQSIWLDFISRGLIRSGELKQMVEHGDADRRHQQSDYLREGYR